MSISLEVSPRHTECGLEFDFIDTPKPALYDRQANFWLFICVSELAACHIGQTDHTYHTLLRQMMQG